MTSYSHMVSQAVISAYPFQGIRKLADIAGGHGALLHGILDATPGFFFSSRRRHTRCLSDWSSDVCSSDLRISSEIENGSLYCFVGRDAMVFYDAEVAMILAVFFAIIAAQKHADGRLPELQGQREDTWSPL